MFDSFQYVLKLENCIIPRTYAAFTQVSINYRSPISPHFNNYSLHFSFQQHRDTQETLVVLDLDTENPSEEELALVSKMTTARPYDRYGHYLMNHIARMRPR